MDGKANQWWAVRIIPITIVYIIAIMISGFAVDVLAESPWRYPVALIPAIPVGLGALLFNSYLNRMDEMYRQAQLQALGFSVGVTGVITFALGLLEGAGLPQLSPLLVFPMLIFFWGFGSIVALKRYR